MNFSIRIVLLVLFAIVLQNTLSAQWTIGEPVSMELSTLTLFSLDECPPTPTHNFWFPISEATGVDHIAIVQTLDSPDVVEIGLGNAVQAGDTIQITSTDIFNVYFYANSGTMILKFYATGTPTQLGDPIPCEPNDLWFSDFPICNISNNPAFMVGGDCTVEGPDAIGDFESLGLTILWPTSTNGYQLIINSESNPTRVEIHNLSGKMVAVSTESDIACHTLNEGIYILSVQVGDKLISRSFVLTR